MPDPAFYNEDLAPTPYAARTWTTYNYIALWFSMSMEVTAFMLASSLIAGRMNWKQAVLTILAGNLIVLIPSNDFSNLWPRRISFRAGGLIAGVIGLAMQPWRLMASHMNYIGWLVSYSGLLGPVAGIMVTDYFLLRHTRLDLRALYQREGIYRYTSGFNYYAIIA